MTSKRKAELQRKLTLASVPKPPAGLAERIKADIPSYLHPEADRRRMSRSIAFSMRVAASILLVVSSVVAVLYLLAPQEQIQQARLSIPAAAAPKPAAPSLPDRVAAAPQATEEVQLEITEEQRRFAPVTQVADAGNADPRRAKLAREQDDEAASGVEGTAVGGVAGGVAEGMVRGEEKVEQPALIAEAAPASAPEPMMMDAASVREPSAAPAPPAEAPRSAPTASLRSVTAVPLLAREARAADLEFAQKQSVFGISTERTAFERIKTALENGQRPPASSVNVEALVNYFAGAPARPPRRGIRLEVEASPAPVEVQGKRAILRFTIDTPAVAGTPSQVAKDARIEVQVDNRAVAHIERVGDDERMTAEPALLQNMSVTGLYQLELRPNLTVSQRVATVRLYYRSVVDNRAHTIEKVLYGRDFAKQWARASRRHRLASLGAVWGESLKGRAGGAEVAQRASELATQDPDDARAGELARAAEASSKMRTGTPTGSGR